MKIFHWMQTKLNGRQGTKKPTVLPQKKHILQEPQKEEFSDWPHGLLAIGTFGNNSLKQESPKEDPPSSSLDQDQLDFTPEEVGKLQKELTKLLSRKPIESSSKCQMNNDEEDLIAAAANLPLDKFLNCPSSLEVDRTNCHGFCEDLDDKEDEQEPQLRHTTSVILSKGKDVCMDNNNRKMHKRSISFLLKKMFVCQSGFTPSPSLRDQMPETRMEKLLKAILHKKIYPQSLAATSKSKKFLENRLSLKTNTNTNTNTNTEDQTDEKRCSVCKWVKTDSEYIVLEI